MASSAPSLGYTPPSSKRVLEGKKAEVCNEIIKRLMDMNHESVNSLDFADSVRAHFRRLPSRYLFQIKPSFLECFVGHILSRDSSCR